ncbi:MAG: YihY/virulence factor BrkB family protein [Aestuariivirga sp.]
MAANVIHGALDRVPTRGSDISRGTPDTAKPAAEAGRTGGTAGTGADSPTDIPARGWWSILKRTVSQVSADRVLAVAGGVTFYGLLSLFPAITVLVSLYGLIAEPESIARHLDMLKGLLPEGAMSIISEQAMRIAEGDQSKLSLAAGVGIVIALWSANAAMKAMMDALNIAYSVEEKRGFIKLNLISLLFTLSSIIGIIVLIAVVAAVPVILELFWMGPIVDFLIWAGRWPLIFGLGIAALAVLYRYGPSREPDVPWRWITPGSLLAAVGLLIFSMLFSWYAANFANYNETYGSLGAVIGFLTWMWLSAIIVLVGAELNAEIENQAQGERKPTRKK